MAVEFITQQGRSVEPSGNVAQRLLQSGMDLQSLRPCATLQKDEWNLMDQAVKQVARERLNVVNDMRAAGMTFNVPNAMGVMSVQHHVASDMTQAQVTMDAINKTPNDRSLFDLRTTPLPVVHHDFHITSRVLTASRRNGIGLDTTQVEEATRQVIEKIEDMVINGLPVEETLGIGSSSASVFGLRTFPDRGTATLVTDWTASTKTGSDIKDDVLGMVQTAHDARHFGPFNLYVPTNYGVLLGDDYSTSADAGVRTIQDRLEAMPSINAVKVADKLPNNEVALVEMSRTNMDVLVGFNPTVVQWEGEGGMVNYFKVMSIIVPRPKSDFNANSGIVHLS